MQILHSIRHSTRDNYKKLQKITKLVDEQLIEVRKEIAKADDLIANSDNENIRNHAIESKKEFQRIENNLLSIRASSLADSEQESAITPEQRENVDRTKRAAENTILASGILIWILAACAYLLPTAIALLRGHPSTGGIFIINLFLGWTFLAWIIALAWSMSSKGNNVNVTINNGYNRQRSRRNNDNDFDFE